MYFIVVRDEKFGILCSTFLLLKVPELIKHACYIYVYYKRLFKH